MVLVTLKHATIYTLFYCPIFSTLPGSGGSELRSNIKAELAATPGIGLLDLRPIPQNKRPRSSPSLSGPPGLLGSLDGTPLSFLYCE